MVLGCDGSGNDAGDHPLMMRAPGIPLGLASQR